MRFQKCESYTFFRTERGPKKRRVLTKMEDEDSEEFQTIEVDDDSEEERPKSSSPGLTNEETNYLKNLLALDIECRSRYPCHINPTSMQQKSSNVDWILDWNKTSLERLSYFAYKVHLFQRYKFYCNCNIINSFRRRCVCTFYNDIARWSTLSA